MYTFFCLSQVTEKILSFFFCQARSAKVRVLTPFAADILLAETEPFYVPDKVPRLTQAGRPFLKTYVSEKEAEEAKKAASKGKRKGKATEVDDTEETDAEEATGEAAADAKPIVEAHPRLTAKSAPPPVTGVPPALAAGEVIAPVTAALPGASSSSSSSSADLLRAAQQRKAHAPYGFDDRVVQTVFCFAVTSDRLIFFFVGFVEAGGEPRGTAQQQQCVDCPIDRHCDRFGRQNRPAARDVFGVLTTSSCCPCPAHANAGNPLRLVSY